MSEGLTFNGNFIKFLVICKKLKFKPDFRKFEDRISARNLCWLLQYQGIDLGYDDFFLHLRGPLSKKLSEDYFKIADMRDKYERYKKIQKRKQKC